MKYSLLLLIAIILLGCSEESNPVDESSFDRNEFLTFMVDEQIVPIMAELNTNSASLNEQIQELNAAPDQSTLSQLRQNWLNIAISWQKAHMFDFGSSELSTGLLGEEIATFPIDLEQLNQYVENEDTSFQNFDRDTRGIYAIEYFLYNESLDLANPGNLAYLKALSSHLAAITSSVSNSWATDGRTTFLERNGTDAGSSLSNLVNGLAKSYEAIKNFKLGLPLGLRPGQQTSEPTRVEAYYSDESLLLINQHFNAISNIWSGKSNSSDRSGLGFEEYLDSVFGGEELKNATTEAINDLQTKIDTIGEDNSLKTAIRTSSEELIELHNLFQQHTRFFKSDLASLLGVSITFNSGDGD